MSTYTMPETHGASAGVSPVKYVYFFGDGKAEGNGTMKNELGGKGAGLAEITNPGLPVPPGFTIQTEASREYMRSGGNVSPPLTTTPQNPPPPLYNPHTQSFAHTRHPPP